MKPDPDALVRVLVGLDVAQFSMACQVLEDEGIPFVVDAHDSDPCENPVLTGLSTAPVYLQVRESDFARARELLSLTVVRGVAPLVERALG